MSWPRKSIQAARVRASTSGNRPPPVDRRGGRRVRPVAPRARTRTVARPRELRVERRLRDQHVAGELRLRVGDRGDRHRQGSAADVVRSTGLPTRSVCSIGEPFVTMDRRSRSRGITASDPWL